MFFNENTRNIVILILLFLLFRNKCEKTIEKPVEKIDDSFEPKEMLTHKLDYESVQRATDI